MLIFLDIDGVMAPAKSWQRPDILEDGFVDFSSKAVRVLQDFLAQNANSTFILTTSHKSRFSLSQWKIIFERRGLNVNKNLTIHPWKRNLIGHCINRLGLIRMGLLKTTL
jgi:ATP-dependent helicase/DNAse subunit B